MSDPMLSSISKIIYVVMALVVTLGVFGPILAGQEYAIERTKSITVLGYKYNSISNQTSIQGIEHTKGVFGGNSYEEIIVDGKYDLELEETYFFRIKTTHQKGKDSKTELVLIAVESW